jgi:hypothetical protein
MDENFIKDRFLQKKETEMLEMKSSIENSWKVSQSTTNSQTIMIQ